MIENLAWIVFRIRGNVPSLPSPDLGGLPSTGLAAPPSTPAQVVQPPPSSGRPLLPLEKLLQFWRLGIGPELELCRRWGVSCTALLQLLTGTPVQVSLLTGTGAPHGSQHRSRSTRAGGWSSLPRPQLQDKGALRSHLGAPQEAQLLRLVCLSSGPTSPKVGDMMPATLLPVPLKNGIFQHYLVLRTLQQMFWE